MSGANTTTTSFTFATPPTTTFSFGTTKTNPTFSFGQQQPSTGSAAAPPPTAAPATATPAATAAPVTAFSFGTNKTNPTFSFGQQQQPSTAAPAAATPAATAAAVNATTQPSEPTSSSTAPSVSMNYRLLEESVKEWEEERAGLETNFVKQATQVNASDQLLWASAKRVAQLNSLVERAQLDQQQLEHEVDYEAAQLAELERLLEPLESAMRTAPTRTMRQHADLERDYTYRLADNINSQLNCVSRDILDIVEHFNAANASSAQDKALEMISKVLSSHMDALKWIKHNSDLLQQKLQDLERFGQEQRTDSLLKR